MSQLMLWELAQGKNKMKAEGSVRKTTQIRNLWDTFALRSRAVAHWAVSSLSM